MSLLLAIDPGKNTGVSLGFYDAVTPYRLHERWQVRGAADGFIQWWRTERPEFDELVIEKFVLDGSNEFVADLSPVEIEGALRILLEDVPGIQPVWQFRSAKASLIGYPPEAKTKAQRQRLRSDFLKRFGLYAPGEQNQDSMDCIVHSLVYLKLRRHMPTLTAYWPERKHLTLIEPDPVPTLVGPTF